jgi:hypothetical protein
VPTFKKDTYCQIPSYLSFALSLPVIVDAVLDCKPLHMKGSRKALFKVRLSSHRYTSVILVSTAAVGEEGEVAGKGRRSGSAIIVIASASAGGGMKGVANIERS